MRLPALFQSLAHQGLRRATGLLLGSVASLAVAAGSAQAEPRMWVVKDADSTIYLFGTIHALRPELQWRSAKIDNAFKSADELILEIADVDDTAKAQGLFLKYGLDRDHPLSAKLDPEYKAKLASAAEAMGVPPAALDMFRPWLAGLTLTIAPLVKAGYDPKSGVEMLLKAEAVKMGKPVSGFETLEQQVMFFATLEPSVEMAFLKSTLDDYEKSVESLDGMSAAWARGDVKTLETDMINDMRRGSPGLYKVLLIDRNTDWAKQIKAKLAGKGTAFVAVGAAHLTGPDSVQNQLKKLGVKARAY